jgi:uncharacterized protein YecT (DUF1311 family)
MKTIKLKFLLSFLVFSFCYNLSAQTQGEMNDEAYKNYKKADLELNKVYKKLLNGLDKKEKEMLIKTQKDWLKFRDSNCEFEAEENEGGSIQLMVWAMCLEEKAKLRIKDLKASINSRNIK